MVHAFVESNQQGERIEENLQPKPEARRERHKEKERGRRLVTTEEETIQPRSKVR